jgi:hypothetical protein
VAGALLENRPLRPKVPEVMQLAAGMDDRTVLIDADFADLDTPIPWWKGRTLRFRFPPR